MPRQIREGRRKYRIGRRRGVRAVFEICAELIDNIPGRDDTIAQKVIKLASIVEVVRRNVEDERGLLEQFVRDHELQGREDSQFVNLFWSTPMKDGFRAAEIPIREGQQVRCMSHEQLGNLYFVEYTGMSIERSEHFFHDADFDFDACLEQLWSDFAGRINVKFIETALGSAAAYGALSIPDDPFCGSARPKLEQMVAKHAQYRRDHVSRTYLLIGAPGLGKSMLAIRAAMRIGSRTLRLDSQSLNQFGTAEMRFMLGGLKPDSIIIDDIDKADFSKGLPTLLTVFEWIKYDHPDVAVLITTNSVKLNEALLRPGRIDEPIWFEPPDVADRRAIIEGYLKKYGVALGAVTPQLIDATQGMGASWLKEIALQMRYESPESIMAIIDKMHRLRQSSDKDDDDSEGGNGAVKMAPEAMKCEAKGLS